MQEVLNSLLSDRMASDINSDACLVTEDYIDIHFWDGRRFCLSKLPDGCKYDSQTRYAILI